MSNRNSQRSCTGGNVWHRDRYGGSGDVFGGGVMFLGGDVLWVMSTCKHSSSSSSSSSHPQVFAESVSQLQLEGAIQEGGPSPPHATAAPPTTNTTDAAPPQPPPTPPPTAPPTAIPTAQPPPTATAEGPTEAMQVDPPAGTAQEGPAAGQPPPTQAPAAPGGAPGPTMSRSNSQQMAALASRMGNGPVVSGGCEEGVW